MLYIIAVISLCFGVAMLVLYRREKQAQIDDEESLHEQADIIETSENTVAPPPGFENPPPPNPANMAPPPGFENPPPPVSPFAPQVIVEKTPSPEVNVPLDFSDSVFAKVVSSHGIHDGASFLAYAGNFDADGNGYLRQSELNRAAEEYVTGGHNQLLVPAFSDEQLLAGGWTQEQIDAARDNGQI